MNTTNAGKQRNDVLEKRLDALAEALPAIEIANQKRLAEVGTILSNYEARMAGLTPDEQAEAERQRERGQALLVAANNQYLREKKEWPPLGGQRAIVDFAVLGSSFTEDEKRELIVYYDERRLLAMKPTDILPRKDAQ